MLLSLVALSLVIAGWALVAKGFERRRLTVPIVFVGAGVLVGLSTHDALATTLNARATEHAAELILSILLFVDATDVRGGLFGRNPRAAARMLLIALPLSMCFAVLLGAWLLPGMSLAVLLLIACIVVPTDFAPAAAILRDTRIPERVRNLLNVEAGYNDGIVSPVFVFALALAGSQSGSDDDTGAPWSAPGLALRHALPDAVVAVVVGAALGAALAALSNLAQRRGLMTAQSMRVLLVIAPILSHGVSVGLHGNGFVAAFVCGIAFHYLHATGELQRDLELLDDIGFLLTLAMWFVFGSASVLALADGVPWRTLLFCVLALTAVRVAPVVLALTGSGFDLRDRAMVGWLGPRGTPSIVFGLLSYNVLDAGHETRVLLVTTVVVLGSVLLHGIGYPASVQACYRPAPAQ
ncbi:MAG: cation:proton antiporter [Mycobacterium sp.]